MIYPVDSAIQRLNNRGLGTRFWFNESDWFITSFHRYIFTADPPSLWRAKVACSLVVAEFARWQECAHLSVVYYFLCLLYVELIIPTLNCWMELLTKYIGCSIMKRRHFTSKLKSTLLVGLDLACHNCCFRRKRAWTGIGSQWSIMMLLSAELVRMGQSITRSVFEMECGSVPHLRDMVINYAAACLFNFLYVWCASMCVCTFFSPINIGWITWVKLGIKCRLVLSWSIFYSVIVSYISPAEFKRNYKIINVWNVACFI